LTDKSNLSLCSYQRAIGESYFVNYESLPKLYNFLGCDLQ